ncbi:hypothetical protein OAS86_02260 [Gammaproteobacteria bacterium]|nr:hypothetical protein [Gammaproteobacteria bacterium]
MSGSVKQGNERQLTLFQTFVDPKPTDANTYSQTLKIYDQVPAFSISRRAQANMRTDGHLDVYEKEFVVDGQRLTMQLSPALFLQDNGTTIAYYPADIEEAVIDYLRALLCQSEVDVDFNGDTAVYFTISALQKELARQGKTRSCGQITESLNVLNRANVTLFGNGKKLGQFSGPLIANLIIGDRGDWNSKCRAEFPGIITRAIRSGNYRQTNYTWLSQHRSPLERWLYTHLCLHFTNAGVGLKSTRYSLDFDVVENSGLLIQPERFRRLAALRCAFRGLQKSGVIDDFVETRIPKPNCSPNNGRVYKITPTRRFAIEVTAANMQRKAIQETIQ